MLRFHTITSSGQESYFATRHKADGQYAESVNLQYNTHLPEMRANGRRRLFPRLVLVGQFKRVLHLLIEINIAMPVHALVQVRSI